MIESSLSEPSVPVTFNTLQRGNSIFDSLDLPQIDPTFDLGEFAHHNGNQDDSCNQLSNTLNNDHDVALTAKPTKHCVGSNHECSMECGFRYQRPRQTYQVPTRLSPYQDQGPRKEPTPVPVFVISNLTPANEEEDAR